MSCPLRKPVYFNVYYGKTIYCGLWEKKTTKKGENLFNVEFWQTVFNIIRRGTELYCMVYVLVLCTFKIGPAHQSYLPTA
jgi:hypothetical protein